jgi:hypothetical protein
MRENPEIYMPKNELHFFYSSERGGHGKWERGVEWYEKQFRKASPSQVCGEKTPTYSYLPEVPKRIKSKVPNTKIIWILRDPVERTYSHYWHEVKKGRELLSFKEAIVREEERVKKNIWKGYKKRSKYYQQINRFLKYFDIEQMYFCLFEDMKDNPRKLLKEVFNFLDVDESYVNSIDVGVKKNETVIPKSKYCRFAARYTYENIPLFGKMIYEIDRKINNHKNSYPDMKCNIRRKLTKEFNDHNRRLKQLVGLDIDKWSS